MTLARALRGLLITVVVITLICVAVIASAPLVARELTRHYLAQSGVDAEIGNVDINLFAGTLAYDDIHGTAEAGDGFEIGHLAVNIEYLPLLSHQISITRLAIDDARVDVRRTAENALRVGGIPVLSADNSSGGPMRWGLALRQLAVGGLTIHYSQPAMGDTPAVDRKLVFNDSSARDVVTWDQDNDVPIDADLSIGDSRIRLTGRVTPFGNEVSAHFQVRTDKLSLDLLSPITRSGGLERLSGTVDADQQIDLDYTAENGLDIAIQGEATWLDSRLVLASGPRVSSRRFHWQGRFEMQLLQDTAPAASDPSDAPAQGDQAASLDPGTARGTPENTGLQMDGALPLAPRLRMDGARSLVGLDRRPETSAAGTIKLTGPGFVMDAKMSVDDLEIGQPGGSALRQTHVDWKGKSSLNLGGSTTTLETDSRLDSQDAVLVATNGATVKTGRLSWQGNTSSDIASAFASTGDGTLELGALDIDMPGSVDSHTASLTFKGRARVTTGDGAVDVHTDGDLSGQGLNTIVPDTLKLTAERLELQGTTDTGVGQNATTVDTDGSLTGTAFALDIDQTATVGAGDIDWHGKIQVAMGTLFSRQARGQLVAADARLAVADTSVALTADRLIYDGSYGQIPDETGNTLVLNMQGMADAHNFNIMNTAIDSPWVSLLQVHGDGLAIDGLERIGVDAIKASGVGLLGDSDSNIAVLEAITASAKNFRLRDLLHYRFETLDMEGTNIHLRRDKDGMGVISKFFGGAEDTSSKAAGSSGPSASYAFDTLDISGPALMFTDTAVEPNVVINGSDLNLAVEDLDSARPDRDATFRLSVDVGAWGHLDSRGTIAPLASNGVNMDVNAWLRSLAMRPLSGYLNAALGRRIANGAADGTLTLKAKNGQLDGNLDTTLSNFRLVDTPHEQTSVALGISLDTALALIRGQNDVITFQTAILGDATNPYFSIRNLVREAVLAGLRTAILSDYSPVGLLNRAKNAVMNIGRSLVSRPALFRPGRHYIRPEDREYLGRIAQAMNSKPDIRLTVTGHAVPNDADQMSFFHGASVDEDNQVSLLELARKRGQAVRDYLAARDVNPDHITLAEPVVDRDGQAQPEAVFSISR